MKTVAAAIRWLRRHLLTITFFLTIIALTLLLTYSDRAQKWAETLLYAILELLAIALLAFILSYAWRQSRRKVVPILPFQNLTGATDEKDKYDALTENFGDLLRIELKRINAIRATSTEDTLIPGQSRQGVRSTILTGKVNNDDLSGTLKSIGDITIGPVHLPLGGFLAFVARARQGSTITGSIQRHGSTLTAVASYGGNIWMVENKRHTDETSADKDVARTMARDLAYEMLATLTETTIANTDSYRALIEGIESYQEYLRSSYPDRRQLLPAQRKFEQSAILDRKFALAYYNLGLTLRHYERDSAAEMFKLALQCEPDLLEAYYGIAQAQMLNDQIDEAICMGERVVAISSETKEKAGQALPIATGFLGYTLAYKARYKLCDGPVNEQMELYHKAIRLYDAAIREFQRQENALRGSIPEKQKIATARKITMQRRGKAYLRLAKLAETPGGTDAGPADRKAEGALKKAVKAGRLDAGPHILLGNAYYRQQKYDHAATEYQCARDIAAVIGPDGAWAVDPYESKEDMCEMLEEVWTAVRQGTSLLEPERAALEKKLSLMQFLCVQELSHLLEPSTPYRDEDIATWTAYIAQAHTALAVVKAQYPSGKPDIGVLHTAAGWLGKVIVNRPFMPETYDHLAKIYEWIDRFEGMPSPLQNHGPTVQGRVADNGITSDSDADQTAQCDQPVAHVARAYRNLASVYATVDQTTKQSNPGEVNPLELLETELRQAAMPNSLLWPAEGRTPTTQVYQWAMAWSCIRGYQGTVRDEALGLEYLNLSRSIEDSLEAKFAFYDLGEVHARLSSEERAFDCLRRIPTIDPWYWHGLRAQTLMTEITPPDQEMIDRAIHAAIDNISGTSLQKAFTLLHRAEANCKNGRYEDAIRDCWRAVSMDPAFVQPYWYLAFIYYELRDYDKALDCLERMVKTRPDQETRRFHIAMAEMYRQKARQDSTRKKKWLGQAIDQYQRIIEFFGDNTVADANLYADLRSRPNNLPEARSLTRRPAVQSDPLRAENAEVELMDTHMQMALALMELKRYEEALSAWRRALMLGTGLPTPIESHPAIGDIHAGLGYVLVRLMRFDEAEEAYGNAIQQYERCCEDALRKRDDRQATAYRFVLALTRNDLSYFVHAERKWQLSRGIELTQQALSEVRALCLDGYWGDEEVGAILDTQGWILYQQGKYDEAQEIVEQAIQLTNGTAYEHGHLALIYERQAERSMATSKQRQWSERAREQWKVAHAIDHEGIWAEKAKRFIHGPAV